MKPRSGAPARTAEPKFRIDAATELISDVPPPRDRLELQKFAAQRLGKDVVDLEDVDLARGFKIIDAIALDHGIQPADLGVAAQDHVTSAATIATIGTALRHVLLAPQVAAAAGTHA